MGGTTCVQRGFGHAPELLGSCASEIRAFLSQSFLPRIQRRLHLKEGDADLGPSMSWCQGRESNPHGRNDHRSPSPACLPSFTTLASRPGWHPPFGEGTKASRAN